MKRLSLNLFARVFLLVSLGLGVIFAGFALLGLQAVNESTDRALQERLLITQITAQRVDDLLQQKIALLEATANSGADFASIKPEDSASILRFLKTQLGDFSTYVALVDKNGRVVWTEPVQRQVIGADIASNQYLARALNSGKPTISGFFQVAQSEPTVAILVPTKKPDGSTYGVLYAAVNLGHPSITRLLSVLKIGKTGFSEIVDEEGFPLVSTWADQPWAKCRYSDRFAALIQERRTTVGQCHDCHTNTTDKRRGIMAFTALATANWGVVTQQGEEEAFASSKSLEQRLTLFGAGAFLTTLFVAWLLTRSVVRPIQTLTRASQRIAEGDLTQPVRASGGGEISALAHSFDSMRERLKNSLEEIQRRNQELDALYRKAERRAQRIAASNEIIRAMSSALTYDDVFQTFAEQTRKLIAYDRMSVALCNTASDQLILYAVIEPGAAGARAETSFPIQETATALVRETREPFICPDLRAESRFAIEHALLREASILSCIVLPLLLKDHFLGALNLGGRAANAFTPDDLRVLTPIAAQLAIAIENIRLREQIHEMAIHEERDRLGRELHDGLGQVLGYVGVKIASVSDLLCQGKTESAQEGLNELTLITRSAYADVREAILGLRATVTAGAGLESALREYLYRFQREWNIASELTIAPGARLELSSAEEVQLLRIVQEALTNVRKHARAKRVWVRFEPSGDGVLVEVADDGCGFDPAQQPREQFGLQTMRERAESVGGQLCVESAPGKGTRVYVTLPRRGTNGRAQ